MRARFEVLAHGVLRRSIGFGKSGLVQSQPLLNIAPEEAAAASASVRVALCAPGEIWGGVEQFIDTLSRHLIANGVAVIVIVLFDGPLKARLEQAGVPVVVVQSGRYDPRVVFGIARILRQYRINVVHTHGYKATILGTAAARISGARLVRTEHGRLEPGRGLDRLKMRLNVGLESLISRHLADAVVFVSEDVRSQSRSARSIALQQVIYNGVEPTAEPASVERLDGIDDGPEWFKIGIVGRIVPVKGHVYLLQALQKLRALENVRLYVFGEGPLEDDCRRLSGESGLAQVVRFMGFKKNVQDYVRRLDVLVMPSLHEGLPYALLEAMYQKVPVIASDVGGLAETIQGDVSGILVPPGDAISLAQAIERLYRDAPLRRTLAANAYKVVCDRFLIDNMAARYLELYKRVISGRAVSESTLRSRS